MDFKDDQEGVLWKLAARLLSGYRCWKSEGCAEGFDPGYCMGVV